jgi:hypothetical protein
LSAGKMTTFQSASSRRLELPPSGGRESTNKIKVIKRRCYGIFDENSLFRRIFLDTEGYARFLNRTGVAMV